MFKKTLAGVTALLLALGMVALATSPAAAAGPKQHNGVSITICHATGAGTWQKITPNVNSIKDDGHINPSTSDIHANDIVPAFWYDVHVSGPDWDQVQFLGKNLTTVWGGYTGEEILENGCAIPAPIQVTPGYSVQQEQCVEGEVRKGHVTVTTHAGLTYTLTGPGDVDVPITNGQSAELEPGVQYLLTASDADPNDKYAGGNLSVPIVIPAYDGQCGETSEEPETVEATATPTQAQCVEGELADAFITVDLVDGVTYTITKNGQPVAFDENGKTGALEPGDYLVEAEAADGYALAEPYSVTITIVEYEGECGEQELEPTVVEPDYSSEPMQCIEGEFYGGFITVDLTVPGVTYTITKNGANVPFDEFGKTGALAEGDYLVEAVDADPNDGYVLEGEYSETVTIVYEPSEDCEQVTLADVEPKVSYTEATCAASASYVLSNNQTLPGDVDPAVFWTVGGDAKAEGVAHSAAAGSTVKIIATANGPDWGFTGDLDGILEFEHTFAAAPDCGELTTLALTGQSGSPALAAAGFLGLLGVALIRSARRATDLRQEA